LWSLDVGDEKAVEALVAAVEGAHGAIDVFVSNAGYGVGGGLDLATSEWQRMMNVHTWSHLYAARAVIPGMVERGGGYLLNTASAAGLLTQMDSGPYAVNILGPAAAADKDKPFKDSDARQAAADGILEPEDVAQDCVNAMRDERFLVLPHKEVETYFQRKANDYDRWLGGMRRFRRKLIGS